MTASTALPPICEEDRFKKLAESATNAECFAELVKEHIAGYTQRKLVLDALKELVTRSEAIEQKLVIAKAIGKKAGELDEVQQYVHKHFDLANLKEKVSALNNSINASLDAGELTAEELEPTLDSLKSRLEKAKLDGKEKLVEKLQRQVTAVSAAKPTPVPVKEVKEIFGFQQQLEEVQQLGLKPRKDLTAEERDKVKSSHKVQLELDLEAAKERSQMWFESDEAFGRRLEKALEWYYQHLEELKQQAIAEEKERRRLEALAKEEQKWKEMEAKIEQKRLAALEAEKDLTPSAKKHAQQSKSKTKKTTGMKVDAGHFFREPSKMDDDVWKGPEDAAAAAAEGKAPEVSEMDSEEVYAAEEAAASAKEAEEQEKKRASEAEQRRREAASRPLEQELPPASRKDEVVAPSPSPSPSETEEAEAATQEEEPAPKPKARPKPVEKESMWKNPAAALAPPELDGDPVGPSLADSLKAPKKRAPAPQGKALEAQTSLAVPATVDPEDIYAAEEAAARQAEEAEEAERLAAAKAGKSQKLHTAPEQPGVWSGLPAEESATSEVAEEKEESLAAKEDNGETEEPAAAQELETASAPKPKPRPRPVEKESLWGQPAGAQAVAVPEEARDPLPSLGPSLADSLKAGAKRASAQPKKKGTKKFAKVSLGDLGFEYSDAMQQRHADNIPSKWATPDVAQGGE